MQTTAARLRALRTRLKCKQDELAERLGVSRNYVSMLENGREPSDELLYKLQHLETMAGLRPPSDSESISEHVSENLRLAEEPATYRVSAGARGVLQNAREKAQISLRSLAQMVNYPESLLRNIEGGSAPISEKLARKLVEIFPALELDDLLAGSESANIIDLTGRTGTVGSTPHIALPGGKVGRYVPKLSYSQAGALEANWSDDFYAHEGTLAVNLPINSRAFAVTIRGDSMEPAIYAGDDVIVLHGVEPRNGQMVVACTTGGDVMCKVFTAQDQGRRVILTSYNSALHPPIELSRDELRWVYPVHSFNRQVMH